MDASCKFLKTFLFSFDNAVLYVTAHTSFLSIYTQQFLSCIFNLLYPSFDGSYIVSILIKGELLNSVDISSYMVKGDVGGCVMDDVVDAVVDAVVDVVVDSVVDAVKSIGTNLPPTLFEV